MPERSARRPRPAVRALASAAPDPGPPRGACALSPCTVVSQQRECGPDTSITTGPSASKDAWSAQFSPSISVPVRGLSSADGGARIAATTHLQRQLPAVTPLHPTLAAAILAPPSALDKPGALYIFDILADQPNRRTCHTLAQAQIWMAKIGHSKHPWKHWAQWLWKCRGQQQDWWAYWNVPYAAKFEALIHLHFKLLGAWMLPSECHFCGIRHTKKFGFRACGGRAGIVRVVVFYLRRLGWPVDEVAM
ncbi:hypothetical protein B0H10DRAFT_1952861 [Mycena sp. CBHHK59/15]|nr:hypothetical protein B0H10DRAFT_1952861 [Mycena sp. CBHHK59/15]